jgi:hypothetical protein
MRLETATVATVATVLLRRLQALASLALAVVAVVVLRHRGPAVWAVAETVRVEAWQVLPLR